MSRRPDGPYEVAGFVFGTVAVCFGLWGAIDTLADGDGVGSGGFLISVAFIVIGAGRIYLGLIRRG